MKSRKLIGVYTGLLIIAVATMIMLWRLKTMPKAEVFPRDYPEIKEEGILRLVTEYNQSGYYVAGDTIEGFQYELSQAIAQLSGLEIQIFLEMSLKRTIAMPLPAISRSPARSKRNICSPNRSSSTNKS